jgi:arginine decarboxylase-like protein
LKGRLQQELGYAAQLFQEFEEVYLRHLKKHQSSVIQSHSGKILQETLVHLIDTEEERLLLEKRDNITKYFNDLKSKKSLLNYFQENKIDYWYISSKYSYFLLK